MAEPDPYIVQPVLSELYDSQDLLDFDAPGPSSPPPPQGGSFFSSVSQIAAGVTGRAAVSGSQTSPGPSSPRTHVSPPARASSSESLAPKAPKEKVDVRCVEGYGNNLYVGGSDGAVEWWVYDGAAGTSENRGWKLRHRQKVFPTKAISKIVLLPKVSKALILAEGTLHPFTLPGLEPVPSTSMPVIRGVVSVALNDDELDLGKEGESITDMTVVVVRRKGLAIYRMGNRMTMVKEIPLPAPPRYHALFSTYLCAALPSETGLNYSIIDLSEASLTEVLPVAQVDPPDSSWSPNPNVVVIPGENQFLVTSYTGANTMGVFLNGQGDPERGTIEWTDHPIAMAVESGFIIALSRNNTVVVHLLTELEHPVQTIQLDSTLEVSGLSYSPYGISIRDGVRDEQVSPSRFTLLSGNLKPPSAPGSPVPDATSDAASPEESDSPSLLAPPEVTSGDVSPSEEPPSGSGLTPPSSPTFERQPVNPKRSSSLLTATSPLKMPFSSVIAETLLVGRHCVQGLVPTPIVQRLALLCKEKKNDEAIALVADERRRGRRGEIDAEKQTHLVTMRYLHQYLACHLLVETVFERAGDYFIRGKTDPRLLVRLFPEYRGKVIGSAEDVDVFEGLKPLLVDMDTVKDMISAFLSRNSPPPSETEAEELGVALYLSAKNMLTDFLRRTRASRRKGGGSRGMDSRKIDLVVDTTLAKLLADEGTTHELLALLAAPNDVVIAELEPFLAHRKYILSTIMLQQGKVERVLELLKEIAESPTPDPLCDDPIGELVQHLDNIDDPELLREYLLWLVKREPDRALKLLIAKGSAIKVDDAKIVDDLRAVDTNAATRYLEYAVVGKRSLDRDLHEQLLGQLLEQAGEMVFDDGIKYHLEELDSEFRLQTQAQSYVEFFTEVAPQTPFKTLRLKLMLFLQGSGHYDLESASSRLENLPALVTERAIVFGRLGRHSEALQLLARDLSDPVSAQTYCTQGGEIVPPKVARAISQREPDLKAWTEVEGRKRRGTVDGDTQTRLVKELLRAYMTDDKAARAGTSKAADAKAAAAATTARAAELLAAQGVHLDVLEILDMAPNDWPLDIITTFYKRSFRRDLHERAVWQILKSISAGQNLETSERYLEALSHVPPVTINEDDEKLAEHFDEKLAINESAAVHDEKTNNDDMSEKP